MQEFKQATQGSQAPYLFKDKLLAYWKQLEDQVSTYDVAERFWEGLHPAVRDVSSQGYQPSLGALAAAFEHNKAETIKRGRVAAISVEVTEENYDEEDGERRFAFATKVVGRLGAPGAALA
ncbi:hypothetical protein GPECTOR_410g252 [Gonium pectorale]|uniref:Uncharacterized protein n=1 Tax=Gonium pectorale TaxID=33097 RepID=A0A150FVA3_GONPE|nr:hypothetical protein GPECTOR_410g252 [Gonium pectorale]|eukprot:KXZ41534.1 hypothetical protein GPECTOR_410g252 [Gonium pectorale]